METETTPAPRDTKTKAELAEIIRVQKAMLVAIAEIESELEIEAMPEGTYHGFKFG